MGGMISQTSSKAVSCIGCVPMQNTTSQAFDMRLHSLIHRASAKATTEDDVSNTLLPPHLYITNLPVWG
jgi:hypothetical protein